MKKIHGQTVFDWLHLITGCNLDFSFCESALTRKAVKLDPISIDTATKYSRRISEVIQEKIAAQLPNRFGLVMDSWKQGENLYRALFASYVDTKGVAQYPFLWSFAFDEPTFSTSNLKEFVQDVLEAYGKGVENVMYLVTEYNTVHTSLADELGIPMIGCASHRFDVACHAFLQSSEPILERIQCLMYTLFHRKYRRQIELKTDAEVVFRDAARWSTNFEMLQSFFQLYEFIDQDDPTLAIHIPTAMEMIALKKLLQDLKELRSTSQLVQDPKTNLSDARLMFDEMMKHYPIMQEYIASNSSMVHSPDLENAVVKVLDREVDRLNDEEKKLVDLLREVYLESTGGFPYPAEMEQFIAVRALKKQKMHRCFDIGFIPPTSNLVQRLFDGEMPMRSSYYEDKSLMHLKLNRNLWDASLVCSLVIKS
jgi:hypothetical protein